MGKEKVNQVQEALISPGRINPRSNSPRHTATKQRKIKDRDKILKSARKKGQITYKGTPIRLSAYFSTETLQARRGWHDIFKEMKGKELQPRMFYPARLSFRFDGGITSFSDKQKLREFSVPETSFTTNAKGTYLGRKHKRKKRPTENKLKQLRKQ